jgi:hypothetical protein
LIFDYLLLIRLTHSSFLHCKSMLSVRMQDGSGPSINLRCFYYIPTFDL